MQATPDQWHHGDSASGSNLIQRHWESNWEQPISSNTQGIQAGSIIGTQVYIVGFVEHAAFNGLPAQVTRQTEDGRYDLRLADGTKLRWVKARHFEVPSSVR